MADSSESVSPEAKKLKQTDNADLDAEIDQVKADIQQVRVQKRERLKNLDFYLLDNSIRESTVGQLRSHTLQNKIDIFNEVQKVRAKDMIVASFAHMTRVDDDFVKWLKERGEDFSRFFSFSEVSEGIKDDVYDTETVPFPLQKNKLYGIPNPFFEVDLANDDVAWGTKFTAEDMAQLIYKWMKWTYENIDKNARVAINFRDIPSVMQEDPKRLLYIVKFLANLPAEHRPWSLAFEDPMGESLPEELEAWTASIRRTMTANGWNDGKILVHIHQKWDLQTASQLDCLSAGADGVWASMCEEGASVGHACASVTMMNLVRLGNTKILQKFNCTKLRSVAQAITKITTGRNPHPKQVLYGERATDLVFGGFGIGDFDLAEFFGIETPNRITTLASPEMIRDRLEHFFGIDLQFNVDIGLKMKEKMLEDLRSGRKEEYNSEVGIAVLFDRAGGQCTKKMRDVIAEVDLKAPHHQSLIKDIREEWDFWDSKDRVQKDDRLQFDNFYHGFMQPYFGCYRCVTTKKGLKALDMDEDGYVDWNEFLVYVKWALRQYPNVSDADELMSIVFEKGLIPAMRDERVKAKAFDRVIT